MKRHAVALLIVLLVSLVRPASASAGFWAWMEEWSGPGPFKARPGRTLLFTACYQDGGAVPVPSPISNDDLFHLEMWRRSAYLRDTLKVDVRPEVLFKRVMANPTLWGTAIVRKDESAAPDRLPDRVLKQFYSSKDSEAGPGHHDKRLICAYFDLAAYNADKDQDAARGYPQLHAETYDFGPSVRLHDGFDLGVGFGWVNFSGEGVNLTQKSLTPLRIVIRPLLLAVPEHYRKRYMGVLSLYYKETYVIGRLSGASFGAPANSWTVNGELIRSFGINLDLTALVPARCMCGVR